MVLAEYADLIRAQERAPVNADAAAPFPEGETAQCGSAASAPSHSTAARTPVSRVAASSSED